jgi:hypothetical protein
MSVNTIESIVLQNVGPFKDVEFKIPLGISTIYGLNRASGPASKNTNGVGKSFLGSTPYEMIYEDPIIGEKSDRVKQGKRVLKIKNSSGKSVLIKREMRGKSEKLEVEVDGVAKKFRTPTIARQFIKKIWPINQTEYGTYVHIDSQVPHPLVRGSTAERKQFFTAFFGLDKIDAERKLYSAELKNLSKVRAAFNELRAEYLKVKKDVIDPDALAELEERATKLKRILARCQKEFTSVQELVRLTEFEAAASEQIAVLKKSLIEITETTFQEALDANKWELQKITDDLIEAETWEQYKRDNKHYTEAYNGLSDEARALIKEKGIKTARLESGAAAVQRLKIKASLELLERALADEQREFESYSSVDRVAKPEGDLEELRTLERVYEKHLDHASRFEDGKCETCGQAVQIKDPRLVEKKLKRVRDQITEHDAYRAYATARQEAKGLSFKIKAHERDIGRERERLAELVPLAKISRELKDLPRKPKAFEGKKLQVVVLRRMLDELRERRSLLKYLAPHLQTIIQAQALTDEDRAKVADSSDLTTKMTSVQEKLSKLTARIEVQNSYSAQARRLRARLKEMRTELADEEALKILVHAYDDRNIKKMVVEAISQKLMGIVNRIAKKVMPEDYEFTFEWNTQINILVHRRYGKETKPVTDVRRLSGAEGTLFTLILACALLAFVPERKRAGLMILDEPSARLSSEMIEHLKQAVAVLSTMIPSIVIITPKDEIYEGAKPYTVVKDREGHATIFEGFPHEYKQ